MCEIHATESTRGLQAGPTGFKPVIEVLQMLLDGFLFKFSLQNKAF